MTNQNCAVCGQPMKVVPAGISRKTLKPYNSFLACPNKCQQPKVWEQRPTNTAVNVQQETQKRIDKAVAEKRDNIKFLNAINNSCLLAAHDKILLEDIESWVNKIYNLVPKEKEFFE